jgi:O-6-methylguanine DNA methyltransferase
MTDFKEKVFDVVAKIPKGEVLSYGQVASLAGNPKAYRAVARILSTNYDPAIPCHRVIYANGKLGGYNRHPDRKLALLQSEGVHIDGSLKAS